jgi:hypothetical protein
MDPIRSCLQAFKTVSLAELDKVKLMNRIDLKFCLHISQLPAILEAIKSDYSILEINGETIFKYDNTYFDTADDKMFLFHHNGRANRFKIRVRNYVESNLNFLEVKLKNNKGRTIKDRVLKKEFRPEFTDSEIDFLTHATPFEGFQLIPKMGSFFNRFTLVDKLFSERVTIDICPGFKNPDKEIILDKLVIIEIKQSKSSNPALICKVLQDQKIRKQGFSKYCVGRALLEENIKKNNFKPLLLKIRKQYLN